MPGTWSGYEKLSRMKNQRVMIFNLLCDRHRLGGLLLRFWSVLPIFVINCTGPGAFHFLSTEEGDPKASLNLHERNNL
jgi:hypothetical protein